jgi:hypothetical protein
MRRASGCDAPARITRDFQRWLDRIEIAQLYHHSAIQLRATRRLPSSSDQPQRTFAGRCQG